MNAPSRGLAGTNHQDGGKFIATLNMIRGRSINLLCRAPKTYLHNIIIGLQKVEWSKSQTTLASFFKS